MELTINPQWNAALIVATIEDKATKLAAEIERNERALRDGFRDVRLLERILRELLEIPVPVLTELDCEVDRYRFRHIQTNQWMSDHATVEIAVECADSPEISKRFKVNFLIQKYAPLVDGWRDGTRLTNPIWEFNDKENKGIRVEVFNLISQLDALRTQARRQALHRTWAYISYVGRERIQRVRNAQQRKQDRAEQRRQEAREQTERERWNAERDEYRRQEAERAALLAHLDGETQQAMNWLSALIDDLKAGGELDQKQRHVLESVKFVMSVQTYAYDE